MGVLRCVASDRSVLCVQSVFYRRQRPWSLVRPSLRACVCVCVYVCVCV
jgi:hypothetical protein